MELKVFGRSLFEFRNSRGAFPFSLGQEEAKKSKYLPDFYERMGGDGIFESITNYAVFGDTTTGAVAVPVAKKEDDKPKSQDKNKTPKEVFELQLLHDEHYTLNTNPAYIDEQLEGFKDKLSLISAEEYDMRNGVKEISSIVIRLENRKKYPEFADFFSQYPYTTTTKIQELTKAHDYLKVGQVAQFIADLPKEATQVMKEYNKVCDKLCGKQAVFYIVADKKDFKGTNQRRDPILLAQSPFGHVWQILGAWDKEMLFIEEL